ncbi:MAG: condensation domain-containing protein, partial [Gammaproteobacteria bacterium]|nr:condensation domain-containing protein [Gammaproteobacteria bacterium]
MISHKEDILNVGDSTFHESQLEIFYDHQRNSDNPQYNVGGYIHMQGNLQVDAFKIANKITLQSNDALSSKIVNISGEPTVLYGSYDSHDLALLDYRSHHNSFEDAINWIKQEYNRPIDIMGNPLVKQALFRLADTQWIWVIKCHHIIIDGLGFVSLFNQLADNYTSVVNKKSTEHYAFPSYRQEVISSKEYFCSEKYSRDKEYWQRKFENVPEPIFRQRYGMNEISLLKQSEQALTEQDNEVILKYSKLGFSIQQLFLTALSIYLNRYSANSDIVIGLPIHNRRNKHQKKTVGVLMSISPCLIRVSGDASIAEHMALIKKIQREDYRHQKYPISHLYRNLNLLSNSRTRLFDATLNYDLFDFDLNFEAISSQVVQVDSDYSSIPLGIRISEYGDGRPTKVKLSTNLNYFSEKESDLILDQLLSVFRQILSNDQSKICQLNIVSEVEKQIVLGQHKFVDSPRNNQCIHERFEAQVHAHPSAIALVYEDQSMTYLELNQR